MPSHAGHVRTSVIIPTCNEAAALPRTLRGLARSRPFEVLVADAHSRDATRELAISAGCRVIDCPRRQRAQQMNLAARAARGESLLFLHADTIVPGCAVERIAAALADPAVAGGGFARRYDSPSNILRVTCWLAECRNRWLGWHLGDQGMFVRREAFEHLGGFAEIDMFEDLDFSRRLRRLGKVVTLRPPVISSPRRFEARGALATTFNDLWLTGQYLASTSPIGRRSACRIVARGT